jgi:hypothetical protein
MVLSHSVVSGGGSGSSPNQCGTYNYLVEGGTPESGFNYTWKVYTGSGTGGTQINSGFSVATINAATVQISWTGDLAPGTYTLEATKTSVANGCISNAILVIAVQNSFDLQVAPAGQDCKGEVAAGTPVTISWTVNKLCGTTSWGFTWYLFAQDINNLPGNYLTVNDGTATLSGIAGASIVFNVNGVNGQPYTQTVYTLFIVNPNYINPGNNYNKFYLKGIPETSEILTD